MSFELVSTAVKRLVAADRNSLAAARLVAHNQGDAPTHSRQATMTTNPDGQPSSRPGDHSNKPLRIIVWIIIAVIVLVVALVVAALVSALLMYVYLQPK